MTEDPDVNKFEPDPEHIYGEYIYQTEQGEPQPSTRVILPPPISKTKGSGTQKKDSDKETIEQNSDKKKKSVSKYVPVKFVEPKLDENGMPLGYRTCSVCNIKDGHNARSCKERKKQLLKTAKPRTIRRRFCKMCKQMAGHKSTSCPLLQLAMEIVAKKKTRQTMRKTSKKKFESGEEDEDNEDEDSEDEDQEEEEEDEEGNEDEEEDDNEEDDEEEENQEEDDVEQTTPPPPPQLRRSNRKR